MRKIHSVEIPNRMNDLVEGCKIDHQMQLHFGRFEDIYGDMDVNLLKKTGGNGIPEAQSISDEHL